MPVYDPETGEATVDPATGKLKRRTWEQSDMDIARAMFSE